MKEWTVDAYISIGRRERVNEEFDALSSWMMENREAFGEGGKLGMPGKGHMKPEVQDCLLVLAYSIRKTL